MRKRIVAGNWKMNKTLEEGATLATAIVEKLHGHPMQELEVLLAPPFIHLSAISKLTDNEEYISLAAQNCNENEAGAFTGEISAAMLKSVGVTYVIIGHSERRQYFQESHVQLARKVDLALENELTPVFCCGEPLAVREKNEQEPFVCKQLEDSLFHLSHEAFSTLVIAYEPVWAIGTGKTATPGQAQQMHASIRKHIEQRYGYNLANKLSILYGGSCNPQNARELFACPDVDGGLIGGASLKADDFVEIVKALS